MTCCFSFRSRRCSYRLCEPFRDAIELGLSQGRNARAIWQDLVSESGFGQPQQPRAVKKLKPITAPAPWSAIRRPASTGPVRLSTPKQHSPAERITEELYSLFNNQIIRLFIADVARRMGEWENGHSPHNVVTSSPVPPSQDLPCGNQTLNGFRAGLPFD
jgi:hypothetical protein